MTASGHLRPWVKYIWYDQAAYGVEFWSALTTEFVTPSARLWLHQRYLHPSTVLSIALKGLISSGLRADRSHRTASYGRFQCILRPATYRTVRQQEHEQRRWRIALGQSYQSLETPFTHMPPQEHRYRGQNFGHHECSPCPTSLSVALKFHHLVRALTVNQCGIG